MDIKVDTTRAVPVVRVTGDMRLWGKQALSDQLRETLRTTMQGGATHIVLNLTAVSRIDSRGVGCLARCHATAITSSCEISLVLAPGMVLETLKQLNFVRLYPIYFTELAALEAIAGGG